MQTKITLTRIPNGPQGTQETIQIMSALAREGANDIKVRTFVANVFAYAVLVERVYRTPTTVISAIDDWMRQHYEYLNDGQTELLRKPEYMVTLIDNLGKCYGDCDDIATFMACIYRCLEYRVRFVAIRTGRDTHFDHVFVEVWNGSAWLTIDPTTTKYITHVDYGRMVVYA